MLLPLVYEQAQNFGAKKAHASPWVDPEGGGDRGSGPLQENHKNIGFLRNTGPDPLKNHKATIQFWVIIGTPANRHLNGVSLAGRCWPAYSGICYDHLPSKKRKNEKKTSKLDPLWQNFLDPRMQACANS